MATGNGLANGHSMVRCAIYTRKSTEEGLEQSFNTLDAQREAGEAFINSQRHEGWIVLPDKYDDGGYTGANMDRPALKRLLDDVKAGAVNCIVVYKVDRLTRCLENAHLRKRRRCAAFHFRTALRGATLRSRSGIRRLRSAPRECGGISASRSPDSPTCGKAI